MSEETQQQPQQHEQHGQQHRQHLQQQNQQQHNNKATKDAVGTTAQGNAPTNPPRKSNIHEMRNQEFVSRLMAATPPYLYSAPVGPNNFFFSDMLRSLVQARNNENARNLQLQQTILARRPRKRTWSQHRPFYEQFRERKESEEKNHLQQLQQQTLASNNNNVEKPLELTNKTIFQLAHKYRKTEEKSGDDLKQSLKRSSELPATAAAATAIVQTEPAGGAVDSALQNSTPPAASLPPQDLVLPPPPPVWYPSLYPPYGIDPLHFFIDLRVSGHIYDRKKENSSPLVPSGDNSTVGATEPNEITEKGTAGIGLSQKHRHGSAFSVPVPRTNDSQKTLTNPTTTTDAINLSAATKFENYAKYYDFGESKENQPFSKTASANYMLQQLPRLYSHFAAHVAAPNQSSLLNGSNTDTENKSDCDADSDGRASTDDCPDSNGGNRDIDVEIIDSIKYRTDGESSRSHSRSRCSSGDDASITQID